MIENISHEKLSRTELSVLGMIVGGMSDREIAFALDLSVGETDDHIKTVFEKLGAKDRAAAAQAAIERGLVQTDI